MGDLLSGKDEIRYEYLDASNNVRHHGNLRFAQLTLFSALTGGLMAVVFGRQPPLPVHSQRSQRLWVSHQRLLFRHGTENRHLLVPLSKARR